MQIQIWLTNDLAFILFAEIVPKPTLDFVSGYGCQHRNRRTNKLKTFNTKRFHTACSVAEVGLEWDSI